MGPKSKGLHIQMRNQKVFSLCFFTVVILRISNDNVYCADVSTSLRQSIESNVQKVNLLRSNLLNSTNSPNNTNKTMDSIAALLNSSSKISSLPLEKVYPSSIYSKPYNTSDDDSSDVEAGEILRKALINHTLSNGGEGDLDELIFSTLPEGKKLVLQTVRITPTDEHGHPIDDFESESALNWDVKLTNATEIEDDEDEDENEQESRIEGENETDNSDSNSRLQQDLAIAGSHSQANYKSYGDSHRDKEKTNKYYHGNDHGKTHKVTDTDTDGVKVKKYHGTEDGLTDYVNSDGKSQRKEGERYRDTKKKNKGRRVSGFKRVYHKEEFQRTEHFYDDEDAKRIAESYGLKDAKENKNHGTKGDDRKYHGIRNEYTDGNKLKNEHGTSHGFKKGQHTEYKDTERHNQGSHYDKNQHSPHNNYHNNNRQQQNYHPNHNYYTAYSHPKTTLRRPVANNAVASNNQGIVAVVSKAPMTASFIVTEYSRGRDTSTSSSTDDPTVIVAKSSSKQAKRNKGLSMTLERPDELKTFHSPREHPQVLEFDPSQVDITSPSPLNMINPYHTHTREQRHQQIHQAPRHRNAYYRPGYPKPTPFHNKIGNASLNEDAFRKNYTNYYRNDTGIYYDNERYARNYPTSTVRNTILGSVPPGGYSTIVKVMPVKYINLTDEQSVQNDSRQQSINSHQVASPPGYRSSQKMNVKDISFTTMKPLTNIRRPPPTRSKWITITFGDPELTNDPNQPQAHPNHNYNGYNMAIRPISDLVRGVKSKLMQPILRPRYVTPSLSSSQQSQVNDNRFDPSKYPPNVVKVQNANSVGSYSSVSQSNSPHPASTYQSSVLNTQRKRKPYVYIQASPVASNSGSLTSYQSIPSYQSSNNGHSYTSSIGGNNRPRSPHQLPPFMNNLMDSVANFFSNVG